MAAYLKLEELKESWDGEVCIFGAGELGKYASYDLLKAFDFHIDFYCDNYIPEGTYVREGIMTRDIQYLYDHKKEVIVFLCLAFKYQEEVLLQLESHRIEHVAVIDRAYISNILDSIDKADEEVKKRYHAVYDDTEFLVRTFRRKMGYDLDIENPKTFNEKLQWLKLYDRNPEYTQMVDKFETKKYVADKIGKEYIIPTLGVFAAFDEIDFAKLPQQFVLKCTHDSGSIVICRDKNTFDIKAARNILEDKLKRNYYWAGREWPYKNVERKILAEEYMASPCDMIDYKFMCFNGKPRMIFTCTERYEKSGLKVTFFDLKWNKLNFERHYPSSIKEISKPSNLDLMIELAEVLSSEIPFVRVDFYEIKGQVYFGEMTFFPGGGMEEFRPLKWDYILGGWIDLPA